jgi:hypothetical protein
MARHVRFTAVTTRKQTSSFRPDHVMSIRQRARNQPFGSAVYVRAIASFMSGFAPEQIRSPTT